MKLAIFDMDGTLYNTNDINYYSYKEALSKYNVEINYDYYCRYCNGRHYKIFVPSLVNNDNSKVEDIHNLKKENYSKHLNKVKVNNHLFDIIEGMRPRYKIALVTTASRKNTYQLLEYTEKTALFDLILTAEDVKKHKPDPEGFLKAINFFGAKEEDCIIFEDSDVGVEAALKTKASVVRIESF